MKKIFIITSLIFYCLQLQAQCFDFYVQTPNNSIIKACSSGGYSSSLIQEADTYSRTFAIQASAGGAGTVQLNTGSLPNGIYVLHVHDGTDNPPFT